MWELGSQGRRSGQEAQEEAHLEAERTRGVMASHGILRKRGNNPHHFLDPSPKKKGTIRKASCRDALAALLSLLLDAPLVASQVLADLSLTVTALAHRWTRRGPGQVAAGERQSGCDGRSHSGVPPSVITLPMDPEPSLVHALKAGHLEACAAAVCAECLPVIC